MCVAAVRFLKSLDRAEEASARTLRFRVDRAFDRPFHVVRGDGPAIVELCLRMELERVLRSVRRDFVALGKLWNEVRRAGLVIHQPVEQALDHRPVLPIVTDCRIERGDVVLEGDDYLSAPRLRCYRPPP